MLAATIKDVAKLSNVSIATVSKYLNGGNVKEENKINIENAIRQLDYRVNTLARGLKINRSMTVGILVDSIRNTFYTSIISIAEDCLHSKGYSSIICKTKENSAVQKSKLDFLLNKGVDGILIFTTNIDADLLKNSVGKGASIVVIDCIVNGVDCDFITTDNISGSYQATEQFILKGHKDIAIITGEDKNFSALERLKGYRRALEDYSIPVREDLTYKASYDLMGGYGSFKKMLSNKNCIPSAVLIANYFMTVGSVIAINEDNINIPEDISIICFDDLELSKVFKPKLTSVIQRTDKIGEKAVALLLDRIEGDIRDSRIIRIPPKIIINNSIRKIESTDKPADHDSEK
jgi:LacI family transcriptional regulator